MGTQPPNNQPLCFYGGTEMTSQDNLRDRIADVIVRKGRTGNSAAQAIIDEFGLTMEANAAVEGPRPMRRVIGEWEWA